MTTACGSSPLLFLKRTIAIFGGRNRPFGRSSSWNRNITVAQPPLVSTARSSCLRTSPLVLVVVGQLFQGPAAWLAVRSSSVAARWRRDRRATVDELEAHAGEPSLAPPARPAPRGPACGCDVRGQSISITTSRRPRTAGRSAGTRRRPRCRRRDSDGLRTRLAASQSSLALRSCAGVAGSRAAPFTAAAPLPASSRTSTETRVPRRHERLARAPRRATSSETASPPLAFGSRRAQASEIARGHG